MKQSTPQSDVNVMAVLHRAGRVWRGLIANVKAGKPALIASREFTADRSTRIEEWLTEHQVSTVLCVLPASSVICRNCALPDASAMQLDQALRLQAESHLLGIAAPHRLAMAVLPNAPGETTRAGIILAWPESATIDLPAVNRPMRFVPDVAAMAAILNGQRPTDPLLWLDRADGSIAMAMTHAGGANFRATREDAGITSDWQKQVGRIVAETALSVGHTGPYIDAALLSAREKAGSLAAGQSAFFLPGELVASVASRITGASGDPGWWSQYGIAAGALLARTGQLASLTQMQQAPPIDRPSRMTAVATSLSRPRTAATVVLAAVLLLMIGPIAIAGARLAILKMRFGDIDAQLKEANATKQRLAMYNELQKQQAWPMTKLLADVVANAPVGIELEDIRIESGKNFSIGGTAVGQQGKSATEVVASMRENLLRDNLFSDISIKWLNTGSMGGTKFDLSGSVTRPWFEVAYKEDRDFVNTPLQVRLYGPRPEWAGGTPSAATQAPDTGHASSTTSRTTPRSGNARPQPPDQPDESATADASNTSEAGAASSASDPRRNRSREIDGEVAEMPGTGADGRGGLPPSMEVPPELSDAQIKAMSEPELRLALTKISEAKKYLPKDDPQQERLQREFRAIIDQLKVVRAAAS